MKYPNQAQEKIKLDWLANPDWYNDVYIPLFDDENRTKILYGGRDTGKSQFISQILVHKCLSLSYFKCILSRKWDNTIRESQWETIKGVVEEWGLDQFFTFNKAPLGIRCVNGNRFIGRGLDKATKMKSIKDPTHVWIEEADEITEDDYDTISLSLRNSKGIPCEEWMSFNSGAYTNWIPQLFFPEDNEEFEQEDGMHTWVDSPIEGTTILHTCYKHNQFITDDRIKIINRQRNKPVKYQRNALGIFVQDVEGALWSWDLINDHRVRSTPNKSDLVRVVVAIDPATTSNDGSDEAGIVVAAKGADGMGYVLRDASGVMSPNAWARKAIELYHEYEADAIVAERNNGGDMVETIVKGIDRGVRYKGVWASRGKRTRAEPVASLYEEGQVKHLNSLPKLETEMTTWDASSGSKSPNRIDAMVWAISDLLIKSKKISIT